MQYTEYQQLVKGKIVYVIKIVEKEHKQFSSNIQEEYENSSIFEQSKQFDFENLDEENLEHLISKGCMRAWLLAFDRRSHRF